MKQSPQQSLKPLKAATKHCKHTLKKPWPKLNKMCKGTKSSPNESQDHPEQLKQFRPWKQPLQFLNETAKSRNTKFWNMPHETDVGNVPQYDVQSHLNQNRILGNKVAQVLKQKTQLADEIFKAYQTPSEKLKKDPIMALVTKTVATYMFIKHNNGGKRDPIRENFSSWGEPFFNKKE
jgi:hypothetical protein